MDISSISSMTTRLRPSVVENKPTELVGKPASAVDAFSRTLNEAVDGIKSGQAEANLSLAKLAAGENVDVSDVMISMQQSSLSFQLFLQARTKVVEAYQEIMRMQV
jgi:flagellar hook-basal body complex protein FliE